MPNRKWPFRKHSKLEHSIKSLRESEKRGHDVTNHLSQLYQEKAENISAAIVYYSEKDIIVPGIGVNDISNNQNSTSEH